MTEDERTELQEAGAICVAQTAVIAALMKLLQEKAVFSADDINDLYEHAMTSLEVAEPASPDVIRRARKALDRTARNLAGGPTRPR
jgi:predicted nucleic acid-binding protein